MTTLPKLTQDDIDALVDGVDYHHHGTLTIAILTLTNGATVIGQSNVLNPDNYEKALGCKVAFDNAKAKLWEFEGYAIKTRGK